MKITKEKAEKMLANVPNENFFYCCNGFVLKNLEELQLELRIMSDEVFFHHVNNEKNDFSNWIKDIIDDEKLADNIKNIDKKNMASKIKRRITYLRKIN